MTDNEINSGLYILEVVMEHAPQLLENMPDDAIPEPVFEPSSQLPITVELVQKAVAWDKRHKILSIKYHVLLKEIAQNQKTLNESNEDLVRNRIKLLISKGFDPVS